MTRLLGSITHNVSGIAEGRDLKDKSFNLAQMQIEIKMIN